MFNANKDFLGKRRDRAIATILSFKEKECDTYLPQDVSYELRKIILDQINDVVDLAYDLINDDIVINEAFLQRLDEILNM
jgi:hypothetical protein